NEDCIRNWPHQKAFDLVIANPPFGLKIDPRIELFDTGLEKLEYSTQLHTFFGELSAEMFTIMKGLESINYDGKVVCVASQGILFRQSGERRFREYLVQEGLVDTIISLPGGLLSNTGIPICIIILTKKRNSDRVIRMIDASNYVIEENKRNKTLDAAGLLDHIKFNNHSNIVRLVPTSLTKENDYNLSVQRYFVDNFRG